MSETPAMYNNKKLDREVDMYLKEAAVEYLTSEQYDAITYKNFLKDKMLIIAAIRKGIPYSLFELIQKFTPFSESDWADFLGLSTKSMYRYKQSPDHLFKPIHTEKIIEMAEVTQLGLEVFESMEKFNLWLHTPNFALGKHEPIELLKDSYGKEMVMNELTLIDQGIFAWMEVFRLAREKYAATLSGKGAAMKGARWNSPGVELIYTATNRSLAMAEVAVHLTFATLPKDFMMVTIYIPDNLPVKTIQVHDLPPDWNVFPHPDSTRHIGNNFVHEQEQCLLMVPSAVTKGDFNMLINPNHMDFSKITIQNIEKFPFDRRVFKS